MPMKKNSNSFPQIFFPQIVYQCSGSFPCTLDTVIIYILPSTIEHVFFVTDGIWKSFMHFIDPQTFIDCFQAYFVCMIVHFNWGINMFLSGRRFVLCAV